jgi:hypothetical protein
MLLLLPLAVATSACAGSPTDARSPTPSLVAKTCEQVTATLSDGPDPSTDPVGYAEAQVGPLRGIKAPDTAVGRAITGLADAYEQQFRSDDARSAAADVSSAEGRINKLCPGAAP